MGIKVEFNPDLALRNFSEFLSGARRKQECIPQTLELGQIYDFLKREQRNYWLLGEIPLIETKGSEQLSRPKASIRILEATHFVSDGDVYTKGKYQVLEVFNDDKVHFECFDRIGSRSDYRR